MNKINESERFTIWRDTREKVGHGWQFKQDEYCKGTIIKKLETCDYTIAGFENEIGVERKFSTAEVAQNIYEKRFERELQRMEQFKHGFMICEFDYTDVELYPINSGLPKSLFHKVQMSAKFLQSSLARYMIDYKVKIIYAGKCGDVVCYNLFKHFMRNKCKEKNG